MSGTYYKVKKHRASKATHFREEDVSMKALNDPIPPHHPPSPEPKPKTSGSQFRYFDINLSGLAAPRAQRVVHRASEPGSDLRHVTVAPTQNGLHRDVNQYEELPLRFEVSRGKLCLHFISAF